MDKTLIVGLGNPGKKYVNTRHNIGFDLLDRYCSKMNLSSHIEGNAEVYSHKPKNKQIYIIKPMTYMNLSGESVIYWKKKLEITNDKILVVFDDISLGFMRFRYRTKGSDAGHNGLKNIAFHLKDNNYPRFKIGISPPPLNKNLSDYVLEKWSEEDMKNINSFGDGEFVKAIDIWVHHPNLALKTNLLNNIKTV